MKDKDIKIDLDFGGEVLIYQDRVEKIVFDFDAVSRITGEEVRHQEQEKKSL